ncbi:Hypothetical predicted protein, partial [Mytilus galloprovincialis]
KSSFQNGNIQRSLMQISLGPVLDNYRICKKSNGCCLITLPIAHPIREIEIKRIDFRKSAEFTSLRVETPKKLKNEGFKCCFLCLIWTDWLRYFLSLR